MTKKSADNLVQSIERALAILEILGHEPKGMRITQIAQVLDMHKSTIHRLLSTLVSNGYVEKGDGDAYRATVKLVELGLNILENLDFRKEALPFMKELVDVSRETVQLSVLDQGEVVVVERKVFPDPITINLGLRSSVHCSADGKVLLAYLPREEAINIIDNTSLEQLTVNTITDKDQLLAHLDKTKAQGYAINAEELTEGMRAMAAPILNHQGKIVAAMSIAGPTSRFSLERMARLVVVLKESCQAVSERLGYKVNKKEA